MANDEQHAIGRYLDAPNLVPTHLGWMVRESSFNTALREARGLTGRNPLSGRVDDASRCGCWAGALVYLVLIEQIGDAVRRRGVPAREDFFRTALWHFPGELGESSDPAGDISALWALRACFAHSYSLVNVTKRRIFQLDQAPDTPLVTQPQTPWDGKVDPFVMSLPEHHTVVGLRRLGELGESVVQDLRDLQAAGDVEIAAPTRNKRKGRPTSSEGELAEYLEARFNRLTHGDYSVLPPERRQPNIAALLAEEPPVPPPSGWFERTTGES